MNDIIMLLWFTFYTQFNFITDVLRWLLYDRELLTDYTWYYNDQKIVIPVYILLFTSVCWDIALIILIRK